MNNTRNQLRQDAISILQKVLHLENIQGMPYADIINQLIERITDETFRVVVVGQFSSGKSTFINALIGKDILKHGAEETTATITEIENNPNTNSETCDIYYRDGNKDFGIPCSQLQNYTVKSSKVCNVAKDIRKVIIKSRIFDNDMPIVFCDTPGLNGTDEYHRQQTLEQIKQAHACVYLIQARGLTMSDVDFICQEVGTYQNTFLFVQNFIDDLSVLEGETVEGKLQELEDIIANHIIPKHPNILYKVVGISSKYALLARDESRGSWEGELLTIEKRKKLMEKSRFVDLNNALLYMLEHNHKSAAQVRDSLVVAVRLMEDIRKMFENRCNEASLISGHDNTKQKIERLIAKFKENRNKNKRQLEAFIINEEDEIKRNCQGRILEYIDDVRKKINGRIDECDDFLNLTDYMDRKVKLDLNGTLPLLTGDLRNIISAGFEKLIATAVLRIQQYTSMIDEREINQADFSPLKISVIDYQQEENELKRNKNEYARIKLENEKLLQKKQFTIQNENEIQKEIKQNQEDKCTEDRKHNIAIRNLGSRPSPVKKTKMKPGTRERTGFWGSIVEFFIGEEEYEEEVVYYDASNQEQWDKEKIKIENEYIRKKSKLAKKECMLQAKANEYAVSRLSIERELELNQKSAESIKQLIKEKEKRISVEKEKAHAEAMRNAKRQAKHQIDAYLMDDLEPSLLAACRKQIDSVGARRVKKYIINIYEEACQSRLTELNRFLTGSDKNNNIKIMERNIIEISKAITNLKSLIGVNA